MPSHSNQARCLSEYVHLILLTLCCRRCLYAQGVFTLSVYSAKPHQVVKGVRSDRYCVSKLRACDTRVTKHVPGGSLARSCGSLHEQNLPIIAFTVFVNSFLSLAAAKLYRTILVLYKLLCVALRDYLNSLQAGVE